MNWRNLLLVIGIGVGLVVLAFGLFFVLPVSKFESWVDSRLEIFANMPYEEWGDLHDVCAELAESEKEFSLNRDSTGYESLPAPIRELEPISVRVEPERVTLRFSGGHSRYVHIEYYGDRGPAALELVAPSLFHGVVYPRTDQRPIGRKAGGQP